MTDQVLELLDDAIERAHGVLAAVPPQRRTAPTPCSGFDVNRLAAHLIAGLDWLAGLPVGGTTNPTAVPEPDLEGRSLADEFDAAARRMRANWGADQLTTDIDMGPMRITGEGMLQYEVVELLAHSWDVAVATGQSTDGWTEQAETALRLAQRIGEQTLRGPGMMGAPVEVPADAPAVDRFVAFLGRDPRSPLPT